MPEQDFTFLDPGELIDGDLQLVLRQKLPALPDKGFVPAYSFAMVLTGTATTMGQISLRIGETDHIVLYAGHIGYGVDEKYRGRRYAARACRLILPLAARHGLKAVWITVNPDNAASRRTCEILGAQLVNTVDVPPETEMYARGDRQKCRYRIDL